MTAGEMRRTLRCMGRHAGVAFSVVLGLVAQSLADADASIVRTAAGETAAGETAAGDAGVDGGGDVSAAVVPAGLSRGYWMVDRSGQTYGFGAATGSASSGVEAVAVATVPSGAGLWTLGVDGVVRTQGAATSLGNLSLGGLSAGEVPSALSVTPDGLGYWIFTSRGRVSAFGSARTYGDLTNVSLNGPVVASVATPTGLGYYLIGSDGGVFAFGDAVFRGSMGGQRLNQPVVGIAPDPDNRGYWLVAADGGIFAFEAEFRGSMGGQALNRPVIGAVAFGGGYLMVAADGGIFNFSPQPFLGSLGANPPSTPVIGVAAFVAFAPGAFDAVGTRQDGTASAGLEPAISADASTVVFRTTDALVAGDSNGASDIYSVHRETGVATLVSVGPNGEASAGGVAWPDVSADGRFVVWEGPGNLFGGPSSLRPSIWLRDTVAGTTVRISPEAADNGSFLPSISDDGGVVAFESGATNLVAGDTNAKFDAFVWERATRAITRVSVSSGGLQSTGDSTRPSLSSDGNSVVFDSSGRLTVEDTNGDIDAYVRRLDTNVTSVVSVRPDGTAAGGGSGALSANGAVVAFTSTASDLVAGDTNASVDVFVRDLTTGVTERVSVSSTEQEANGRSYAPSISADGNRVTFLTEATNLVAGDLDAQRDVAQRNRSAGTTVAVSVRSDGAPVTPPAELYLPTASSADGRTVVFEVDRVAYAKYLG
jgi:Tol biopolymer transport system component